MSYAVKEIFKTLQGEGAQGGRVAIFCRFAGCNLWSGLEKDRAVAVCRFCDTDFVGTNGTYGGRYRSAEALAEVVAQLWGSGTNRRFVVLTGGEPLLQVDAALLIALHGLDFEIAVETNGTIEPPEGLDWICVSPKGGTQLKVTSGHELKFVFPQLTVGPEEYARLAFRRFSLQPMDGPDVAANTAAALSYCLSHPQWHLSLQLHKYIGIR